MDFGCGSVALGRGCAMEIYRGSMDFDVAVNRLILAMAVALEIWPRVLGILAVAL